MHTKIASILFIPAIFLLFAAAFAVAQSTGQIKGRILDSQTQQPIPNATVLVMSTNRGANTDLDGYFSILRMAPGKYNLKVTAIGYTTVEIKNVEVKTDLIVEVNTSLTTRTEALGEKVVVGAEVDIIDKFESSGKTTITKETISKTPAQTVDELIEQVGGVVTNSDGKVYVRGGRAFETSYIVDGVAVDNPDGKDTEVEYKRKPPPVVVCDSISPVKRAPKGLTRVQRRDWDCPPYEPEYPHSQTFEDMYFENYGTNPFVLTQQDYQSTFAIDIDDASYTLCRSYLNKSTLPPEDAIRVEEFINHFNYKYDAPREETFNVYLDGAPSRFGHNSQLLRVGIKGKEINVEERQPANITFVVDISGSMNEGQRYLLVRRMLEHIINRTFISDRIAIVTYNQNAQVLLPMTSLRYKKRIINALEKLLPYGSTNVQAGLSVGYRMAWSCFDREKNNCLLLFSDGVANVGQTDADRLLEETQGYAKKGITLSTIGVGMGNYNDVLLEKLGDKGNGFYAYVDNFSQAQRIFDKNLAGALQVIARDVKIQVEFDPEVVYSYRLLGYENRAVADYDFRNEKVDGGEIGPGHSVTALYEIKIRNNPYQRNQNFKNNQEFGRVFVRYKNPETGNVEEISCAIDGSSFKRHFDNGATALKLAACAGEFAEIMRGSYWSRYSNLNSVLKLANDLYSQTSDKDVYELARLIEKARDLRAYESDYFSKD